MWLGVALGGACGAVARYLLDAAIGVHRGLPWGLLVVNVLGSALLGLVTGRAPSPWWYTTLATGFCGALTTFSTFSVTTWRLIDERRIGLAVGLITAHLALGLAAFAGVLHLVG